MRDELEAAFAAETTETITNGPAPSLPVRLAAEGFGTFWLVLGGCGTAVFGNAFSGVPGTVGVALAFGLTVMTMAYALGHVSGSHLNPAVSVGLWAAGRFRRGDVIPYVIAQLLGGFAGAFVVLAIANGSPDYDVGLEGLAQNGYGPGSPGGYSLVAALITETVMTFGFVGIIVGATDARAPRALAPLCIGLALTLIHLISIPITNTSVNPARSTGPALLLGGLAFQQLWLFWLAPLVGGLGAGAAYKAIFADRRPAGFQRHARPAGARRS